MTTPPAFCPHCGTRRMPEARFCGGCGADLGGARTVDPAVRETRLTPLVATPAPAVPPLVPVGTGPRTGWRLRSRRTVAIVMAFVVAGAALGASILTRDSSSQSRVLAYVPKDAVMYAEARLDLPGDQRVKLAAFLAHFPGLADPAAVNAKIGEVLDSIVRSVSNGREDYGTRIKPWFGGDLAVSVPASNLQGDGRPHVLVLASVADPKAAMTWVREIFADSPAPGETYQGVELVASSNAVAGVVGGSVLLVGDPDSVHAAIDTRGTDGLSTSPSFRTARSALTGAELGSVFVDTGSLTPWLTQQMAYGAGMVSQSVNDALARVPAWVVMRIRVENDAVFLEGASAPVKGGTQRTNRGSSIADRLPASTIAVVDLHDVGATVGETLGQIRSDPSTAQALSQFDVAAGMLGGLDGVVGQVGDASLVVTMDGGVANVGLVVVSTDPSASGQVLAQLRDLAWGNTSSLGWTVDNLDVRGTTVTRIVMTSGASPVPGFGLIEPSFAISGDLVVFGSSFGFVESVLGVTPGSSLAHQARYRSVLDRVGSQNTLSWYVDVGAVRTLGEQLAAAGGSNISSYQRDIAPYLIHVDAMGGALVTGGSADRASLIVTVK